MSIIKCKECGKEISDKAASCPHCGYKPYQPSGCLVVIIIGAVFLVVASVMPSSPKPKEPFNPTATASGLCMLQVKQQLNDPGSAEFEHSSSTIVSQNGDTWTVQRPVRAKNAFNATIRAVWECKYKLIGEDFKTISIKQVSP